MTAPSSCTGRDSDPSLRGDPYLESDRLAALEQTGLLDTEPEPEFDTVVALAARIFSAPMASVTLVDDRRQWFKSKIGLDVDGGPREHSLCAVTVEQNAPLLVDDARLDTRFADWPEVLAGQVLSYAGVPVSGRDGLPLGTICVLDATPRHFEQNDVDMLCDLGTLIGTELDLRRRDAVAGVDSATARQCARTIRRALENDEFEVFFQPIVQLATGVVRSVEALVRWRHPERGILGPADFLPVAEAAGMLHQIDRWVLGSATTVVAELRTRTPALAQLGLAVNVLLVPGTGPAWAAQVRSALERSGLPPHALTLEVTERTLDGVLPSELVAMESLVALGCRVSIDDVGTGTSSLARLAELPASEVKISGAFVLAMNRDRRRAAVVRALAGLGRELGIDVVAEGVETQQAADEVSRAGCTAGQGFLWSTPLSPDDLFDGLTQFSPDSVQ